MSDVVEVVEEFDEDGVLRRRTTRFRDTIEDCGCEDEAEHPVVWPLDEEKPWISPGWPGPAPLPWVQPNTPFPNQPYFYWSYTDTKDGTTSEDEYGFPVNDDPEQVTPEVASFGGGIISLGEDVIFSTEDLETAWKAEEDAEDAPPVEEIAERNHPYNDPNFSQFEYDPEQTIITDSGEKWFYDFDGQFIGWEFPSGNVRKNHP